MEEEKNLKKRSHHQNFKIVEIQYNEVELGFVTAVNLTTRTFYVQLCKYNIEELHSYQVSLNEYCVERYEALTKSAVKSDNSTNNENEKPPESMINISNSNKDETGVKSSKKANVKKVLDIYAQRIHRGDIVCAKFKVDSKWYRAQILSKNEDKTYDLVFIDYGNVARLKIDQIIVPDVEKIPIITRKPFGLTCFYGIAETENFDDDRAYSLLKNLIEKYIMIKVISRQTSLQYLVDIPKNAYNLPFWVEFAPKEFSLLTGRRSFFRQVSLEEKEELAKEEGVELE